MLHLSLLSVCGGFKYLFLKKADVTITNAIQGRVFLNFYFANYTPVHDKTETSNRAQKYQHCQTTSGYGGDFSGTRKIAVIVNYLLVEICGHTRWLAIVTGYLIALQVVLEGSSSTSQTRRVVQSNWKKNYFFKFSQIIYFFLKILSSFL